MREEFVARNVAELVTTPKQRKRKIVRWSSEEARRFLESARRTGRHVRGVRVDLSLGSAEG